MKNTHAPVMNAALTAIIGTSKYCCTYCRWYYGDIEPPCEDCDPMDV